MPLGWARRTVPTITALRRASCRDLVTLAIETSCDDTCVAIVEKNSRGAHLLFNEKITSNNARFRGIHPIVALEGHEEKLAGLIEKSLAFLPSNGGAPRPDFVSVTRGPGMRSNLNTGLFTAKGLAVAWRVPLVGVHHMQAHALTPRLVSAISDAKITPDFPFLSVLVSGGHTLLVR